MVLRVSLLNCSLVNAESKILSTSDVAAPDIERNEGVNSNLRVRRAKGNVGQVHETNESGTIVRGGEVHGHLHVPGHCVL